MCASVQIKENNFMEDKEALVQIQAVADANAKNFIRPAKMEIIYQKALEDGTTDYYVLGSDMPLLVFRIFNLGLDGKFKEDGDVRKAIEKTAEFNKSIKPSLKLVPPSIEEGTEYEVLVENHLENGGVEVKLRSSIGRSVTMVEIYRYFDYVTKIFFVSCIGTSFGGQYLFSVTPDSKHIRLILGNNQEIHNRINMINELLQARLLPSYQTISAAGQLLGGKVKAHIQLKNKDGQVDEFDSTFCYDDPVDQTRYAFFANSKDPKQGIILVDDLFDNNKLLLSPSWTPEQTKEVGNVQKMMREKPEEFQKHVVSFFADDLDFRYAAYKSGKLKAAVPAAAPAAPEAK